jgi:hypothetical protein
LQERPAFSFWHFAAACRFDYPWIPAIQSSGDVMALVEWNMQGVVV